MASANTEITLKQKIDLQYKLHNLQNYVSKLSNTLNSLDLRDTDGAREKIANEILIIQGQKIILTNALKGMKEEWNH